MKTEQVKVMSAQKATKDANGKKERQVVAEITIEIFDSIDEARQTLGDTVVLDLINTQHATNKKNKARSAAVGEPSEKSLRNEALAALVQTPEGLTKLQQAGGDADKLEAILKEKIAELRAAKGLPSTPAESEGESEEEEAPSSAQG